MEMRWPRNPAARIRQRITFPCPYKYRQRHRCCGFSNLSTGLRITHRFATICGVTETKPNRNETLTRSRFLLDSAKLNLPSWHDGPFDAVSLGERLFLPKGNPAVAFTWSNPVACGSSKVPLAEENTFLASKAPALPRRNCLYSMAEITRQLRVPSTTQLFSSSASKTFNLSA